MEDVHDRKRGRRLIYCPGSDGEDIEDSNHLGMA